ADGIGSRTLLLISGQFLDEITGHRPALVKPRARGVLDGFGRDRTHARGPRRHLFDAAARGQSGPVPARHGGLIILGVDGVSDQPRLGTLELAVRNTASRNLR